MSNVIERLNDLLDLHSVESVWTWLLDNMSDYGFDRLFYGFTRFNTEYGVGDREDMLILSNMPDAYHDRFIGDEMYLDAPITTWARNNVGTISWSWLSENYDKLTEAERRVIEFNRTHGLTCGYTIAFRDTSRRHKGAIALTGKPGMSQDDVDAIWGKYGREIEALNKIAHLKLSTLPFPADQVRLSRRQREVLEWVGDGKTAQDIAQIMGLKPATVEKHLKKARDSLSVETTAQAVLKASVQNQIFVI